MDTPLDHRTYAVELAMPSETALLTALQQSDADVAAGLTVPLAEVLTHLDKAADRIEARLRNRPA